MNLSDSVPLSVITASFVVIPSFILIAALLPGAAETPRAPDSVSDVELRDVRGNVLRLSDCPSATGLIAVAFLGVECPLSKRYAPRLAELSRELEQQGVAFLAVDSNQQDSLAEIRVVAQQSGLTLVKDVGNRLADRLGPTRVTEAFVLDRGRAVRYHGRIDDRYQVGVDRPLHGRRHLIEAIQELLSGEPVSVVATETTGCFIGRRRQPETEGRITYAKDVAAILQRRCEACHRPGEAAPFTLASYQDAVDWAETIREVVSERRMPPWHADSEPGQFSNDPNFTDDERETVIDWIDGGMPAGNTADLPHPKKFSAGWTMDRRDLTLSMPRAFEILADGLIEYQWFEIDPRFSEDRWIAAVEIRPGNRSVVHHATLFLTAPGFHGPVEHGSLGSFCIAAMTPGSGPTTFPEGMAKRVPAGWRFLLVVHYVALGAPQSDLTRIGLKLADPRTVHKEVSTRLLVDENLRIPPGEPNFRVEQSVKINDDLLLLAMFPHMHLRGKSFRYEAEYPGGKCETLLNVPRYDFAWQERYVLARPKRLPAGTVLRCLAVYDNSAANPHNPDPTATVVSGRQSTDEMFNGYFDVALADEDLGSFSRRVAPVLRYVRLGLIVVCAGFLLWRFLP